MENRADLRSILPFLPLKLDSGGGLVWPCQVIEALEALSKGPAHSRVDSGEVLSIAISDLRTSLSLPHPYLHASVDHGFALFFDEFLSREESARWFGEVIPVMSKFLLRLPQLLDSHYQNVIKFPGIETGLRLLVNQQPGVVILSQELVASLLSCSFFCLFPTDQRGSKCLPHINFDELFSIYDHYHENLEHKIKCLIHYFERVSSHMPTGFISFERKVLSLNKTENIIWPDSHFWANSLLPLCPFEVHNSGLIEDHMGGALEVDFANEYLGGGVLHRGCVQEEIRFMINPELIAGMLFLPSMSDNEAIEIVGAERYSDYTGYASTFRFSGDYADKIGIDPIGRRKTRIIAIDALCRPGLKEYSVDYLLREVNKAFCGFLDQLKYQHQLLENDRTCNFDLHKDNKDLDELHEDQEASHEGPSDSQESNSRKPEHQESNDHREEINKLFDCYRNTGVVTGNWGCGAFGGDPEVKAMIQWIAASQASRSFISYYTFGLHALESMDQVTQWILFHEWTIGDLWNMLLEYGSQRLKRETRLGFFSWLIPSSSTQSYLAACSTTQAFFHTGSSSGEVLGRGGNEKTFTVELPPRTSLRARRADSVSLVYMFSAFLISSNSFGSFGILSFNSVVSVTIGWLELSPKAAKDEADGGLLLEKCHCSFSVKRRSSMASHSLISL
ncbi:hypothetical protein V2J09_009328 [Rumex salicifolius]